MQKVTGIIIAILESRNAELFQIVDAGNAPRFLFRLVQSRQQHPGKDGDDRNHDEELDQGENLCFHPGSKNRRTRNMEGRRNGETLEQSNIGTIQQSKEERRSRIRGLATSCPALLPE